MADDTPKTRPLWIAIGALSGALVVTVVLLVTRGPDPVATAPATAADASASSAPTASPWPAPPSAPPTAPSDMGRGNPSPLPIGPREAEARERLMVISRGLDEHFRRQYTFPDRLEVLVAQGVVRPKDLEDPWGRAVDYTLVAKARFKLCSRGPDATSNTDDDVCIGPAGRIERPGL